MTNQTTAEILYESELASLRAELAAAREEIERMAEIRAIATEVLATERTARERAEARVKELEEREDNLRMAVSDDDGSMIEMWERTNVAITAICEASRERLAVWIAARKAGGGE